MIEAKGICSCQILSMLDYLYCDLLMKFTKLHEIIIWIYSPILIKIVFILIKEGQRRNTYVHTRSWNLTSYLSHSTGYAGLSIYVLQHIIITHTHKHTHTQRRKTSITHICIMYEGWTISHTTFHNNYYFANNHVQENQSAIPYTTYGYPYWLHACQGIATAAL